jgi:hypothetical protein
MKASLVLAGAALAFASTALPAAADEYNYTRTLDRTVSAAGASSVAVTGINGNVHLYADGGNRVRVHAILKARSADTLSMLDVNLSRSGGTVRVQDVCPTTRHLFFFSTADCDIELEVHYPAGLAANVHSQNGNVAADGARSALSITNTNGNIHVNGAGGALNVKNTNGNVIVADASTNLSVSDTNGNVIANLTNGWRGNAISVRTNAGNVELRVPAGFSAKLDAHTRMGDIRNRANLSSGPVTVTASTTFGNVVISRE